MRDERGAALVEFSIVATVLLVLLVGIVQLGLTMNGYLSVQASSREGGRLAALSSATTAEISERVRDTLGADASNMVCPPSDADDYCVSIVPSSTRPCDLRGGQTVTVEVRRIARLDVPLWGSPVLTLTGRGVFRCEG